MDVGDHSVIIQTGAGLGSVIAVTCSWDRNRSILWAILAGILSWLYVIYFALTRSNPRYARQLQSPPLE
jgi:hypothetical protein